MAMKVSNKAGSGMTIAFPNVCKIPPQDGPPPGGMAIPYPNFATTALNNQKKAAAPGVTKPATSITTSTPGNEAGTLKGVMSGKTQGKVTYQGYSMAVKFEGKSVARLGDPLFHNQKNTPAASAAAAQKTAVRGREISQLRSALTALSTKLGTLNSKDPNDWQNVLQDLAVTASALYVTLNSDDDD